MFVIGLLDVYSCSLIEYSQTTSLPVSVSTVAALENLKKSTTAFTSDKSVPMVEVKPLEKEPTVHFHIQNRNMLSLYDL